MPQLELYLMSMASTDVYSLWRHKTHRDRYFFRRVNESCNVCTWLDIARARQFTQHDFEYDGHSLDDFECVYNSAYSESDIQLGDIWRRVDAQGNTRFGICCRLEDGRYALRGLLRLYEEDRLLSHATLCELARALYDNKWVRVARVGVQHAESV